MAKLAVLASGNGSNFEALVLAARAAGHEAALLVCDRPGAFVLQRAARLGVPSILVSYARGDRAATDGDRAAADGDRAQQLEDRIIRRMAAEARITTALEDAEADLVALAGFMRLLGPGFVARWQGRLVNIHPSLLPAYPGTEAISRAWKAGEPLLGVTVHYVDEGMDTGPVLARIEVARQASLEATGQAIHEAEHRLYAQVIVGLLDGVG
ncbi:MAG: phosphoribosylglycinamide formyltransferase [Spirochaetia bacterium]|jgi:phosphoribosylglycinamide formyltransferase-1|nr:phosphoribosylglycinamide formyltransferase [Spirochaetia bacterium]